MVRRSKREIEQVLEELSPGSEVEPYEVRELTDEERGVLDAACRVPDPDYCYGEDPLAEILKELQGVPL